MNPEPRLQGADRHFTVHAVPHPTPDLTKLAQLLIAMATERTQTNQGRNTTQPPTPPPDHRP